MKGYKHLIFTNRRGGQANMNTEPIVAASRGSGVVSTTTSGAGPDFGRIAPIGISATPDPSKHNHAEEMLPPSDMGDDSDIFI
jgi:hypothetical protein